MENTPLEVLGAIVDSFYEQRHELLPPTRYREQTFLVRRLSSSALSPHPSSKRKTLLTPPELAAIRSHHPGFRTSETIVRSARYRYRNRHPDPRQPDDILIAGIALQGGPDQSFLSVSQSFAAEYAAMPPELQEQLQEQLSRHRPVNRSKPTWKDWSIPATRYAVSWTRLLRV